MSALIDEDSIRTAMGESGFARLERLLRDRWAAQVYHSNQTRERMAKESALRTFRPNRNLGGMRPTLNMDFTLWSLLNLQYAGWNTDPSFEKDLLRHHPECAVKVEKTENRVGWTRSVERGKKPVASGVVLTDRRGLTS